MSLLSSSIEKLFSFRVLVRLGLPGLETLYDVFWAGVCYRDNHWEAKHACKRT